LCIGATSTTGKLLAAGAGFNILGNAYGVATFVQDTTTARGVFMGYDSTGQIGTVSASSAGAASNLAFWTYSGSAWAERARFNSTGAFVLAGGTTTADGIGITFPATQSASTNANTLDDYEEGTWTPTLSFGGASAGITYGVNSGTYTKIGRLVTGRFIVGLSSKGSSTGDAVIVGLPFTVGSDLGSSVTELAGNFTSNPPTAGWPQDATTNLNLWAMGATGVTNTTDANFANNTRLDMWFQYFV
jgi:hypothetical protein